MFIPPSSAFIPSKAHAEDCLFSAIVAAFIIQSYQTLSPNSSDTTNALLTQISQQFVNISNGTPLASVAAQSSQQLKPPASAVRVNVLWFLSLVISLNCGLYATLMQQWARQYRELTHDYGAPHKDGGIRAFLFAGLRRFGMLRQVVTPLTGLLHISVFLFLAGLVDFLIPVHTTVAYTTLGCIGMFALPYAILTVLPSIHLNFPYSTPMSGIIWRLTHVCVLIFFRFIRPFGDYSMRLVSSMFLGSARNELDRRWKAIFTRFWEMSINYREAFDSLEATHRRYLSDGLQKSIVKFSAACAPPTVDADTLGWTLTTLLRDEEIENFVACVPGLFDSCAVLDATSAILPLMSDQKWTNPILGSRLHDLLKTCIPGTSSLTEEFRKKRLQVCLKGLWYCGRAYNHPENLEPLPSYVCVFLAGPKMIRRIRREQDFAARVIGCCFGALVAKKLSADINVRNRDRRVICLSAILGIGSLEVMSLLGKPRAIGLASILSLRLAGADSLVDDAMRSDILDVLKQTLHILSEDIFRGLTDLPPHEVAQLLEMFSEAPNWLKDEVEEIWRLPPISSSEPARQSQTDISHMSQQSREDQVRIGGAPDSGGGDGVV